MLTALALMAVGLQKDVNVDKGKVASQFSLSARRIRFFLKIESKGSPNNRKHFHGVPCIFIFVFIV